MAEEKEKVEKTVKEEKSVKSDAKPNWIKMKPAELEKIVVDLAKKGEGLAKIGLILRDKHGVPKSRLFGKKISRILEDNNVIYKKEKDIFAARSENLKRHIERNKSDYPATRALTKNLWVLNKIERRTK